MNVHSQIAEETLAGSPAAARVTRRNLLRAAGLLTVGGTVAGAYAIGRGSGAAAITVDETPSSDAGAASISPPSPAKPVGASQVAADPTALPGPVDWTEPRRHQVTLDVVEVVAEIEPGVTFNYMTIGGQIPGPMIRVRQGDTVEFTLKNAPDNLMPHNLDFHAVYGTEGGGEATYVVAGQANGMVFQAMYPGAFIYHCAVPILDYHISTGMFGMIVVEPPEGLPPVDHEFYLGQHEIYTDQAAGTQGHHNFDFQAMLREDPTYVLLNGEKHALTPERRGAMKVKVGETARIFFVCGGPNLACNFHPVGNVWAKAWREGAILNHPERYVQTVAVPPGSCLIAEMEFPVPGLVKLVDHALSRVVGKGMLGIIEVEGEPRPDIFTPDLPGDPAS
jgi:nitrite reductase (NO-forming)